MKLFIIVIASILFFAVAHKVKRSKIKYKFFSVKFLNKIAHDAAYEPKNILKYFNSHNIKKDEKSNLQYVYGTAKNNMNILVVAIRGTVFSPNHDAWYSSISPSRLSNLKTDLIDNIVPISKYTTETLCQNCNAHKGFLEAYYLGLRNNLKDDVISYLHSKEIVAVCFTGHSLGGALATLAAEDLERDIRKKGKKIYLVTFGAPRVGDINFKKRVDLDMKLVLNARVTFDDDPIPTVPFAEPYVHCGTEYRFLPTEDSVDYEAKKFEMDLNLKATNDSFGGLSNFIGIFDHSKYIDLDPKLVDKVQQENYEIIIKNKAIKKHS